MIDEDGYRPNVGMIIVNKKGRVFWGKRAHQRSWQFPQGGIDDSESSTEAMYRELWEETGLNKDDVELVGETNDWLKYNLPKRYQRNNSRPLCIGQKQKWFLLNLVSPDEAIHFDNGGKAEFDSFRWVDYWYPVRKVIYFKKQVYQDALQELSELAGVKPQFRRSVYSYRKRSKFGRRR